MDVRKLLAAMAVVLLGLAVFFFAQGNVALGAAMIAIAMSQIATFAALTASANKTAAASQEQPE
jgi:hypothetical protein